MCVSAGLVSGRCDIGWQCALVSVSLSDPELRVGGTFAALSAFIGRSAAISERAGDDGDADADGGNHERPGLVGSLSLSLSTCQPNNKRLKALNQARAWRRTR